MSMAGAFLEKPADLRGPRPGLSFSFIPLPTGYLGIRAPACYASENSTDPAGGGSLFTLILCWGVECRHEKFPGQDRSVVLLILSYDTESDDDGNRDFGLWIVGFPRKLYRIPQEGDIGSWN